MGFGMIILNQSIGKTQNYTRWIQIASSCMLKLSMFMKTPYEDKMFMNIFMKTKCLWRFELVWLGPKTYSYLINDCNSNKKAKGIKICVTK